MMTHNYLPSPCKPDPAMPSILFAGTMDPFVNHMERADHTELAQKCMVHTIFYLILYGV